MKLSDYLRKLTEIRRMDYAQRAQTTVAYLYQIAGGHSRAGAKLAKRLATESEGFVSVQELRPDLYGDMQPILEAEGVAIAQRQLKRTQETGDVR